MMTTNRLTGALKAAILVQSLDKPTADVFLNRLDERNREQIAKILPHLGPVSPQLVNQVAREFMDASGTAHPAENPTNAAAPPTSGSKPENVQLDGLQGVEPAQLFSLIHDEHPQVISLIIASLMPARAAELLNRFPDQRRGDLAMRIAGLGATSPEMAAEVNRFLKENIDQRPETPVRPVGGTHYLAKLLNQVGGETAELIMEKIEAENADLVDEVKQMMFVFEDLVLVDDRGLQKVLRNVETRELALALKAASDTVRSKIFRNMSQRAAQILQEEIDGLGAVRMTDVTDTQKKIALLIKDMEGRGEVIISGQGGDDYVG